MITAPYYKTDLASKGFVTSDFIDGVHVKVIKAPDSNLFGFFHRLLNAMVFALVASWLVIFRKYDVVIASSGPITTGLAGLLAKWLRQSRFVFEVRDLWPEGAVQMGLLKGKTKVKLAYWFESLCYRNADLVIPLSIGMEMDIKKRFESVKTCVVTNVANTEFFKQDNHTPFDLPSYLKGKNIFIYFGSLGLMDACEEIIEAVNLLKDRKDICVVFIGTGAMESDLKKLVSKYALSDRVHFTGLLPKTELPNWMHVALASLVMFKPYPVLSTVSPNKMFDSFAAGLPIIHNTDGWIKELVDESKCGLTIPINQPKALSAAMVKFVDDVPFRKNAASVAFQIGCNEFDVQGRAALYVNAIERLVV